MLTVKILPTMERYHIFKLGLAIIFYAAYCVRPMLVYSLEADDDQNILGGDLGYYQYFHGVDGTPGRDYPIYAYIPKTNFNCRGIESGYYADLEADCQVFHICEEGKKISFLCPNGTIFHQSELICEWWNKANCTSSPYLYEESAERLQNDAARRKSSRKLFPINGAENNHGAVMRVEERTSHRATQNGQEYPSRQQVRQRTQHVKTQRIPDNNEIEQQIEEAESNNRHLANVQNTIQRTNKNNFDNQNQKYNYNSVNEDTLKTRNNAQNLNNLNTQSGNTKQNKKDIDKETGNFVNQNYDQGSIRQSKKFELGEKNYVSFGSKTGQQKTSTLKEYHVEFGATGSAEEAFTNSYNSFNGESSFATTQSSNLAGQDESLPDYYNTNFVNNNQASDFDSTGSNVPENSYNENSNIKTSTSIPSFYGTKLSNKNAFSGTTLAPRKQDFSRKSLLINGANENGLSSSNQPTQKPITKINRGNVKFNTNANNQQIKDDENANYGRTTPVTTYSPPVKYSSINLLPNSQVDTQDNYNLPFPKHKSELTNGQNTGTLEPKQQEEPVSSTEAYINFSSSRKPLDVGNQESEETQVPQESSSFIKNSFNSITDNSFKTSSSPYPNHRSTYSDIKDITYLEAPKVQSISSITAHLVTTQPINNGKPFVGSRVGTTLQPNQPTTLSKFTYLPTSTDRSKSTVIFGVIRHSSTTEPSPYGPLEGTTAKSILDRFNIGITDKALPDIETTTLVTNAVPTESFNIGNTDSTVKPNVVPSFEITTVKPLELLVPEHGSLNIGTSDPLKSVRFNTDATGDIGSVVETSGINRNVVPTTTDRFNIGNTDRTRPTVETTILQTNPVPTETFNVGYTDNTVKPNVVPDFGTSTFKPLEIVVPEQGSLNQGGLEPNGINDYSGLTPVNEPPFVKETVPLLYSDENPSVSTDRIIDHATVYGTYQSTTRQPPVSSTSAPYSPTIPAVTQSSTSFGSPTSSRSSKSFSQGVPIRFENGKDKISIQLSKSLGRQNQRTEQPSYVSSLQTPRLKVNAALRVGDDQLLEKGSTAAAFTQQSGFSLTKDINGFSAPTKSKTEKPRPFAKAVESETQFNTDTTNAGISNIGSTFPAYQISSARPFGISSATSPTPFVTTTEVPSFSVNDNVDNMVNVLQEIANYNSQTGFSENSRPGLIIPPSVGPETLHSLAQYFANELQDGDAEKEALKADTKEQLTNLLTAMTVHGYNNLFNVDSTATPTAPTDHGIDDATVISTKTRIGDNNEGEEVNPALGESGSTGKGDSTTSNDDLLTTTSLPELRQLAKNFSIALSSYLNDPENFRTVLKGFRPTEPPPLEGSDNVESSTTEDELLNFSDADVKPSTPAIPTATWGYIVASSSKNTIQDDVKNSLNPDLHTADSQSFIPRFNNVQVKEEEQKGFTDLPPNHWTTSPKATRLWQKALSVNPAVVNEHFETTPSLIASTEEETTEPELFNQEVLPDLSEPRSQISYDIRELPPLSLNSTQVHGILIDFMNHTKSDEDNRLNRILKKLNTSEAEFLDRMKEIESNPLTKRLVLLLISECGANITQDLGLPQYTPSPSPESRSGENLSALASTASLSTKHLDKGHKENHSLGKLVHPHLSEDDQDARALQLLNSLYTIASKFGKKR